MLKEIKTLILPDKSEFLLYFASAIFLLIAQNTNRYWSYFSGIKFEDVKIASSFGSQIGGWVLNVESRIDPRIADFFVWMLLGFIAISLVLFVQSNIRNANDERTLLAHMQNPKTKTHELEVLSLRIAVRVAAIIGLLVYLHFFLGSINESLASLFFVSSLSLNSLISWLWLIVSISVFAGALYLFAIFARVIALKTRIF